MRKTLFVSAAVAALMVPGMALAQSTGSIEVDETSTDEEVVVTGTRADNGVQGLKVPDGTKARAVITNELLRRSSAGNTVLDSLNLVPGVNFTQSDPYGSAGGNIRIRGFDGNRVSLTFDGFPLNDTGNYAIYSNQQLDPELVQEINVNLGATDIDSPTASAAGGTINYRTIIPREQLSATAVASAGDFDFTRVFGLLQTGNLTSFGTRAFIAASTTRNDKFKGPGGVYKQQYNAGIYQPIGSRGDFIRVSGHYNENRNNFFRNPSVSDLRALFNPVGQPAVIPTAANISVANPFRLSQLTGAQEDALFNFDNDAFCAGPTTANGTAGRPTVNTASCTNYYNVRINPSNTGNVRANSRFTLSDKLTLTADGAYQYTLAHGGGYTTLAENSARAKGSLLTSPGVDYNGDGDVLDTVGFITPNITNTNRYTFTSSLIYNITDDHRVRLAYTYDRGRHRQTGEWGYLEATGNPEDQFSGRNGRPVLAADGYQIQQRNRLSIALLNQVAGQYVGNFFDDKFTLELGLRAPFFKRDLQTFCPIEARGSGFAQCTSQPIAETFTPGAAFYYVNPGQAFAATGNPVPLYRPFKAKYKFDAVLPNLGFVYRFDAIADGLSMFGSYAKGFSAPRTDNLYRAPRITVTPEKTDSFDLGLRYARSRVQAQATGWFIGYKNRIVTTFDNDPNSPNFGTSLDRNVGRVESYGADATVTVQATRWAALTAFGSYTVAELQSDVPLTATVFAPTAGKQVVETPKWQVGGRAQFEVGPVELGIQGKWVDKRFATDVNDVVVPSYTLVDLDARFNLAQFGLERTFFQLNVRNLFDEFYFSNISTQINAGNIGGLNNGQNPNFTVGYPRTFSAGFNIEF